MNWLSAGRPVGPILLAGHVLGRAGTCSSGPLQHWCCVSCTFCWWEVRLLLHSREVRLLLHSIAHLHICTHMHIWLHTGRNALPAAPPGRMLLLGRLIGRRLLTGSLWGPQTAGCNVRTCTLAQSGRTRGVWVCYGGTVGQHAVLRCAVPSVGWGLTQQLNYLFFFEGYRGGAPPTG